MAYACVALGHSKLSVIGLPNNNSKLYTGRRHHYPVCFIQRYISRPNGAAICIVHPAVCGFGRSARSLGDDGRISYQEHYRNE
jgi:hypothetical protein